VTKLKIATAVLLVAAVGGGGAGRLLFRAQGANGAKARGAETISAAADEPKDENKGHTEVDLERRIRELQALEAELRRQLQELKDRDDPAAKLKRLSEAEIKRVREAEREAEIKSLRELRQAFENEIEAARLDSRENRRREAKQIAVTTVVREIENALSELRATVDDKKTEIEALDEIRKAVEDMKRKTQGQKHSAVTSPDENFHAIAAGQAILLLQAQTGKEVRRLLGHQGRCHVLLFAPDGKSLVSGGQDNAVIAWDLATGRILWKFQGKEPVTSITYSRDGRTVILQEGAEGKRRLEANTGREVQRSQP
jgi:hypothetical protein